MDERIFELAKELRHEVHSHPELSNEESWTKGRLIAFLRKNTNLEIVDRGLWFCAFYRAGEGKKNIAFRADFDAIPVADEIDAPYKSQIPGMGELTDKSELHFLELDKIDICKPVEKMTPLEQNVSKRQNGSRERLALLRLLCVRHVRFQMNNFKNRLRCAVQPSGPVFFRFRS